MGDGKSSPFNSDGKSGADGNSSGMSKGSHRGPDRPQKSGPPEFNADSVSDGGRFLKVDPPNDRLGMVNQTATGMKNKPFKTTGKGPSMPGSNAGNESSNASDAGPVGDIPNEDQDVD